LANALVKSAVAKVGEVDLQTIRFFLAEYDAGPQLLPAYVDASVRLYRMFLALKILHSRQRFVPSAPVDEIWHAHILMTDKYRRDCKLLFGRYLDHDPLYGSRSWGERQKYNGDKEVTLKLMHKYFDITASEYTLA
jgi:hypothetical protein